MWCWDNARKITLTTSFEQLSFKSLTFKRWEDEKRSKLGRKGEEGGHHQLTLRGMIWKHVTVIVYLPTTQEARTQTRLRKDICKVIWQRTCITDRPQLPDLRVFKANNTFFLMKRKKKEIVMRRINPIIAFFSGEVQHPTKPDNGNKLQLRQNKWLQI